VSATRPPLRRTRIMLVDDSPTNRLVMVTMLERLGYEVKPSLVAIGDCAFEQPATRRS